MTARDALNSALDEEMSADPRVFLMDEEVGEYQGAYKITKGLQKSMVLKGFSIHQLPRLALLGYYGLKPVVEFMTINFSLQQNQTTCPLVRYQCLLFLEVLMVLPLVWALNIPTYEFS
ncbi:pyruvate dehydrogenase E1 component subunit beta, mitochondrial-like [Olea europaea var. sylvestris]|uniref:pyruvate dehydrogenase E1 component subunit beta, mitochondrial-like n=1 Tax=Olea europaea var. sylvestris TaxID=158386 RepID=UPI000C1CCC4B|nr:pyruvate dehydrogenase E1 component subunit beta, mitochondrial-like [Olea europaea var. sylvestris]